MSSLPALRGGSWIVAGIHHICGRLLLNTLAEWDSESREQLKMLCERVGLELSMMILD